MTVTRIVALLSVLALLASLPLSVALAQQPPFRVVGTAELDNAMAAEGTMVVAMIGEEKAGEGMVDAMGMFSIDVEGEEGAMVTFSLEMMGEGEDAEMMMYNAMSANEVMVGMRGDLKRADLMAFSSDAAVPTATPTAAEEMEAMRGPRGATGARGPQGEQGPPGEDGADGTDGTDGRDGSDGEDGTDGADGAKGDPGADGTDGRDGSDGNKGEPGAQGPAGPVGPAGNDGAQGASGGGALAVVALIIAIVGVIAAGGAFVAGRNSG